MSYQKSVALLSCCLLFSMSFVNLALASVTGTPSGVNSDGVKVTQGTAGSDSGAELNPAMFSALPPDTEGPTLTITPPSDVNLTGCWSDFTYSIAAMGKPSYTAYDECGTATVTETINDTYVFCSLPDTLVNDGTPEGGLTILREFTYLAVDCFGNETTDSVVQSITVTDAVAPSFVEALPADTTVDCAAIPAAPTLTATDDCDSEAQVVFFESSSTTCAGITRTWIAVDDCGNETSHTQFITVTDTENPVISGTPSDMNQTADAGDCGALVTWTAPTATDNCTLDTFTSTHDSGDFFDVGTTTVTYTATDDCGNSTSTSFDVTITDDENPTLSNIPSDITQTADAGQCGAVVTWPAASDMPAPSAADNCSATMTSTHDSGDTFVVGTTTVTYTATDPSGNTVSESFTVTITDDEDPTISGTPADITQTADAGNCSAVVTWVAPEAADNCAVTSFTSTHNSGDAFAVGTTTVAYTAMDEAGNTTTHSFDIVVTDDEDPTISGTPADITQTADAGVCNAAVSWTAPTSDDNCEIDTFTSSHNPGDTFDVGTTAVTYTATDVHGNSTTSTFNVTVTDDENPVITGLPSNITVSNDEGDCGADVYWTEISNPDATDNCSIGAFSADYSSGDNFPVGTTTVTFTAIDNHGNSSTASFTVTVTDAEAPSITDMPGNLTANNDAGDCSAVVTWDDPTSGDNCGVVSFTSTHDSGDTFAEGTTTVTYTAVDAEGNSKSSSFTVTVSDNEYPTIANTPENVSVNNDAGNCSAVVTWAAPTPNDNCGIQDFTSSHDSGDVFAVGTTEVTFTATDTNGNTTTSTFDITVTDNEDPTFSGMPANITQTADAGNCSAEVDWTAPTADDNCTVQSLTSDHDPMDDFPVGTTTVTYTATDIHGNTSTSSFTVTVTDDESPVIIAPMASASGSVVGGGTCNQGGWNGQNFFGISYDDYLSQLAGQWTPGDVIELDGGQTYYLDGVVVNPGNCNAPAVIVYATIDQESADGNPWTYPSPASVIAPAGSAWSIALSVAPASMANITVSNDAGLCSAVVTWSDPTADDNCPGTTLTSSHNSGDTFAVGTTTVTYTAEDAAGNQTTSSFTVTVNDDEAPVITAASNQTVECDGSGNATDLSAWLTSNGGATATDNCTNLSWSNDYSSLSDLCGETGAATVTFTATDDAGNTSTTSATFTIEDSTGPTISAQDFTLSLDGNGEATLTTADVDLGTTDACGTLTLSLSQTDFDCDDLGTNTVTLTAEDECGNSSTQSLTITVEDNQNPVITGLPASITVSNDAGECGADVYWTEISNPDATDNCSVTSFTSDFSSGDTFNLGTTTVTYTAEDAAGNTTTASFTVTVTDDEAPTITDVPSNQSVGTDAGECDAVVTWDAPTYGDNCGVATSGANYSSGESFGPGTTTVTFTATDDAGNQTTASFTVTVTDNEAPTIDNMPADITQANDEGDCGAMVTWTAPTASDNCSDPTTLVCLTTNLLEGNGAGNQAYPILTESINGATSVTADLTFTDGCGGYTWPTVYLSSASCNEQVFLINNDFGIGNNDPIQNGVTATFSATLPSCEANDWEFVIWSVDNEPACAYTYDYVLNANTLCSNSEDGMHFSEGTTTVTYTAEDEAGNSSSEAFTVTVYDNESPVISQMDDITVSTEAGICTADVTWSDPAATDNCAVTSLESSIPSGTTFSLGSTEVTYTAEDEAGNETTMSFTVTVNDNEAPTITEAASDMEVECDGAGNSAALTAWLTDNAGADATDNCSAVTWSNDFTTMANTCGGAGAVQVVFTATDEAGNTSTSTATFTIVDTTAPTITAGATDSTVECDGSGNTTQFTAWLNDQGGATASESCSSVTWTNDYLGDDGEGGTNDFSNGCGATGSITITFTATDVCGNASNTSATFTIEDTTNPTAVAQNHTVLLDASGNGTMVAGDIDNGSSDGCSSVTLSASQTGFTCSDLGSNTITLTVTDACSNASTATATVTVKDEVAPSITVAAADATYECNGTDYSAQFAAWLADNGGADATDACGPLTWTNNSMGLVPGCGDSESEEVTFTVTDGSGNSSTTTATFSVTDTAPPTIASEAIDIMLECNGTGNTVELNAWLLANGGAGAATDLCGDVTWSHNFDDYALTCAGTGAVEVIFSATDDCGNAATTTAMFEIVDTTAPSLTAAAMDLTVECDCDDAGAGLVSDLTYVYALGFENWYYNPDAPEDDNAYTSLFRYDYNPDGTLSNPELMFYIDEFDDELSQNYWPIAYDRNPVTGVDYFMVGDGPRSILTYDIALDQVVDTGVEFSENIADLTFGADGTCYAWIGGNIKVLDLTAGTVSQFASASGQASGGKGLTYDYENDRLLLSSGGHGDESDFTIGAIPIATGTWELLHTIAATESNTEGEDYSATLQGLEFIGNDICLVSGAWWHYGFGQLDLSSGALTWTVNNTIDLNPYQPALKELFVPWTDADFCNATDLSAWLSSNGGATAEELCGNITWTNDFTGLSDDCGNTGSAMVTFTASDDCGNTTTTTATFTIEDTTSPTALGSDLTVILDGNGQATITAEDIDNGSSDACGDVTLAIDVTSFDCDDVGPNDVVLTVTDECMNAASATVTVIVTAVDDAAPTISDVPADIIQTADLGACGAVVTYDSPLTADNCDGGTLTSSHPSGSTFPVGTTTVTFTATDASSNSSTATFTVTVTDDEAPTISTVEDITVSNDAGSCNAAVTWTVPTDADNCAVTSFTSTHSSGDTFDVGTTTVTYTAEDEAGNETTMSFTVTVNDNEDPAIAGTPADITQTADAGQCGAVVTWTAATATDNCGVDSISSDHNSGDTFEVGTTTVTYTATDVHGNTTTSTFDITVTDDEDPTLYNVPSDITQTADAGECGAVVEWEYFDALTDSDVSPSANDNCGMASFVLSHNDGDTFPVGTTTVTITATDIHGNIATASFDVTITDDEAPVIADTPADISQTNDLGNCSAAVTWTAPTADDNCEIDTFTSTHNPGDTFAVGTTTVTYTATDIHSNVTTSSFTVTVTDDEAPVISDTPADITQDNDLGNCSAVVTWTEPTADDNCEIDTFTSTHNPGDTFEVGTTTVTYTATDIHSNVTTSSFDITVEDAENPVITTEASDLTVECDGSGNTTELNNWLNNHGGSEASDNCAVTSITNDYDVANMSDDCGLTGSILVTFTHTDAAGNSATSSATFTIEDTTAPTFEPNTGSLTVECDGSGNVEEIDAWLNLVNSSTASDVCGGVTLEKTTTLLTDECAATGTASVSFLITDDCGNQVDTTLTFTIEDTTGPEFLTTADDLTVECDGAGNTAALQAWLDNHAGATAEDVCGDFTWSNDFDALSDDCGATGSRTVTFTATDECGNASYTSATFTIEDTTAPTIASEAMDMTVECDGAGNTAALDAWLAANGNAGAASDICGGVTWSNDFTALSDDCGATGSATVIFTATDDCGNATSTTATFTIEDTTAPSLDMAAADMTVECDGLGNVAELNNWLTSNAGASASDQCSGVTWSNDFTALSDLCGATGAATVTFTATDDCGLTVSTTATFTIEDTTAPSMDVEAADMTVECDGAGNPTELNDWLTSNGGASASDECSGVTWSNDFTALSDLCGATGAATVTFTATDDCGLSTSTTATFTIEDTTAPVLSGDEIVIIDCSAWPWDPLYQPTIDELLTVVDTAGNPMITLDEACGYTNFPIDFGVMSGGCNYDHQLIYYPVDDCGNAGDSLYQVIQVDDFTEPTFLTVPADTMIACTEDVMVYLEMATAEDACDPSVNMTFEDEIIPTACPEEYTIRRTFYAEDCGYNIAEAVQLITVADTAAPALALTAPADMAVNGCLSSADLSEAAMGSVTWTTSDDCGDVTVTYTTSDANAFSCAGDDDADEGSYVVTRTFTVTATDCAGNSTTQSIDQTITITDDTAPTVSLGAPADETVYLDASCYAAPLATPVSGDASGFLVTATDDCDSDVAHTIAVSDDTTYTGVVDGVGSYEILRTYTVTVTDDCGNEASATTSHTISVLDEINPDVTADFPADLIIYADDDNGYFDPTPLSTGAASADYSDNCSGSGDQTYGVAGQVPTGGLIITAIGDPNDDWQSCRFVEIHNSGDSDIDLTGYALQRWTNGNAGPSTGSNIDLSSIGTMAPGQYAWIANNAGFADCYGFAATITAGTGGPADSNGDDQIAIIDGASNIIDMFGVAGEDGSNTCHEFEDGIALRAGSNTDPNGGAWDESGWIVYSDGSSASGCTNHNSGQPQNASDIALLINNWAGAGPAAPETDFNSVDISYADETTSYTASACYTFERTWTITVTDNNGNATTLTDVQTIQVADTSAPDITALENTTAACDLFGFDLSAGDESVLLAGTSFEQGFAGDQYYDTGDASVDHALENNPGQSDVNFTAAGGEMGFSSYYYATGSGGITDGDYVGVTSFTGVVSAFTDGSQGFQMQDTDGIMEVVFDNVDVSMGGVNLTLDYFPQSTGWETSDRIRIWVVADGGEIDLVDTEGQDIDNLGIEGQWNLASLDLDGFDDVQLHISLQSNSGSEGLFIDNIAFSTGNSPLAALEANGFVSFSDNVELASTEADITLDGTPCEGAYDIVYTATDSCGNTTTSSQRIVLEDTVDPILTIETPEAVTLYTDADCFADYVDGVPYPAASATDNCDDDVEITSSHFDGTKQYTCLPGTGAFSVTRTYVFTATDNCGNTMTDQVTRLVTVVDNTAPTFTAAAPADKTVNIDPFCGANTSTTIAGMPTVTDVADNCDSNVDIDIEHADSAPVYTCSGEDGAAEGSYTFERTFTITGTDDCGNETVQTVTQTITALDVTAPTITALPPMAAANYTLDGDCMADLTPAAEPVATATDACDSDVAITSNYSDGAPTYTCDGADGEAEGSFTFTRTWTVTATDDCGNSTAQQTTQTVVVTDEGAPSIDATWPADYTTDLDADCNADLTPAAAGAATATGEDACDSDVTVEISSADGAITYMAVNIDDVAEGGYFFTRTWTVTATDDCGNSTTETHDQLITANDVTAPTQELETLPTYSVEGCYGEVDLDPSVTGTPMVNAEDGCDSQLDIDLTYSTDDLVFNEVVGDYSLVIDTISGPEDGVLGMTTVRLYIETENEDDFVSAVAGDEINPTGIRTTTSFYQNVFGSSTANTYNDGLTLVDPLVAYDSWVTIGIDQQPDGGAGEGETTIVGDWANSFEAGGNILISDFFGGSWFTTSPNTAAVAGADHRVLLGQFTTDGQMSGQMFVQVFPNGLGSEEMRISFTFGDCAEDDDTPEGSYAFTRRWESVVTDDADNSSTAVTYQHIQVLDTEAPQLTNTCGLDNGETVAYDCPGIGVLDFDPVPVACDVTAIDNCDSEVNVTLFTETEGYIPTDDIRNYCAPMTPEAQDGAQTCDDRAPEALRLFNFPGTDDTFVMADGENLVQVMSDGSMHIELEVENADGTGGFLFTADYGAGADWATWSAGGSNYKKDCADIYPGEAIWEEWVYFLMTAGTLEGTGMYAGSSFTLSHQPANGYYGMQMGLGANNKNTNYGGSAWFFWQGDLVVDGTDMGPMASSGDVYMDLDCCLEWSVDYHYTAIDDCGNPTGFHYTESMGADLEDGDATVSGGHTVGPVDITSVGGIKEPIRITGLAPNPTNDMSQLSFVVSENMRLRVDLYTMSGTLVQELYEGNAVTGVQYVMDIDADALSDGMYQVRISSNSYLAVKKLLVAN